MRLGPEFRVFEDACGAFRAVAEAGADVDRPARTPRTCRGLRPTHEDMKKRHSIPVAARPQPKSEVRKPIPHVWTPKAWE